VSPRAGLDGCGKSRPHRDSLPRPSSLWRVAIPTELSRPTSHVKILIKILIIYFYLLLFSFAAFQFVSPECGSLTGVALGTDRDVQHNQYKVHPTPSAGGEVSAVPAPAVRAIELIQADLMFITC
jgi:hypothetical protein